MLVNIQLEVDKYSKKVNIQLKVVDKYSKKVVKSINKNFIINSRQIKNALILGMAEVFKEHYKSACFNVVIAFLLGLIM